MKQLHKATALALLMTLTGVCGNAVAAPDPAKIEARKKAKTKIMGERTGKNTATAGATDLVPYLVVASNRILLGTPQLAFA